MRSPSEPPAGPLVAVLGASGYVGAAVTAELAARSARLRLVFHRQRPHLPPAARADVLGADLTTEKGVREAVAGADAVVHLAAGIGGQASWRTVGGDAELLGPGLVRTVADAARSSSDRPPVFVLASTTQLSTGQAANDYIRSKEKAETCLRQATGDGLLRGVTLRLATVYGRSPLSGVAGRGVIAAMARKAVTGEPITMWHDGSVRRDLLHVTDAARAFASALDHADRLSGEWWAIGTGVSHPLGEVLRSLAELVAERTGQPPVPVVSVPAPDWADAADFADAPTDPAAFAAATGWAPAVPLRPGLASVADAVLAEQRVTRPARQRRS